jgi:hypothetical protein
MKNKFFKKIFTAWVLTVTLIVITLCIGFFGGLLIGVHQKAGNALSVLSSLSTPVVAAATILYVILTYRLVRNSIQLLEEQNRPRIFVDYESLGMNWARIRLIVENRGVGAAHNIRLSVNPDMDCYSVDHKRFSEHPFLKNGISYISPGRKREGFLTVLSGMPKEDFAIKPIVTAEYENSRGKKYIEEFTIDFSYMLENFYKGSKKS